MDYILKLEESMKVLDVLSVFLIKESENYIKSDDIRHLIEEAFVKIRDIHDELGDEEMFEEIRDSWEANADKPGEY
jgi:hypothetical protein